MKRILLCLTCWTAVAGLAPVVARADEAADRAVMERTMAAITQGFAEGDVDAVMQYHHPDVAKALNYKKLVVGREAVRAEMAGTFKSFKVEFIAHEIESLLIKGDYAIEQTRFAVRGTPKAGGEPWVFRGRAMVVYVRYAGSPTGWASLREMIQPATE